MSVGVPPLGVRADPQDPPHEEGDGSSWEGYGFRRGMGEEDLRDGVDQVEVTKKDRDSRRSGESDLSSMEGWLM